ncbi:putative FMN-dependent luciferase-like monooxygenase [Microbacterium sp. P01]|uniref:putative FMN-dependent luciferase-like monooxygenase n=1 Tax=unclassified Microbacterium TaxID=2609290 RepID=UPI00367061F0
MTTSPRVGFFTRVLDQASAADRYRFAIEQIEQAERVGFASAWLAQHHFHEQEGGLPSPFVLLAAAAQRTSRIALGTAVVTLPLDDPLRVAEDATVLDALSGGRVQLGLATGGTPSSFDAFGRSFDDRRQVFTDHFEVLLDALGGRGIRGTEHAIYPYATDLDRRIWQATFSVEGGVRAAERGDGLLLSRTQPRPDRNRDIPLHDVQVPVVEGYLAHLADGVQPRILASRTALVVDEENRGKVVDHVGEALHKLAATFVGVEPGELSIDELFRVTDTHVGTVDEVVASLGADRTIDQVTDVSFQVHSIDAPHEWTLRSIELIATEVAPRLGWSVGPEAAEALRNAHRSPAVLEGTR